MTYPYAQTNLQLFNQMLASGYGVDDVELVKRGHDLALRLLSGQYRAHGKPFITHLIGTASVLAAVQAPAPVVAAGMLHAVYKHGDFGMEFPRSRRRARVRRSSSPDVEEIVVRYDLLDWTGPTIVPLRRELDALDPRDRDAVLIRLANELEDSLDRGLRYCVMPYERQLLTGSEGTAVVELARDLGHIQLSDALARAMHEHRAGQPPPGVLRVPTTEAFIVVSPSYGLRPEVRLGRWVFARSRPLLDRVFLLITSRRGEL
jgi:hypothetical protein